MMMAEQRRGFGLSDGVSRIAAAMVGAVFFLFALKDATGPTRHHVPLAFLGQDDFFYYLKIAQNMAAGRGSTFNGIVSTNGYHPLWQWCLAAAVWVTNRVGSVRGFLELSVFVAAIATYVFADFLLRKGGVPRFAGAIIAAYGSAYAMHLYFYSMEVTLTVPLLLALLLVVLHAEVWLDKGFLRALGVGLLVSAVVLSRLDTAIYVAMLGAGFLLQSELRRRITAPLIAGLAIGVLPIAAYLAANHAVFGVWEPVSGMAKQLKLDHGFTPEAWTSLWNKSRLSLINLVPIVAAIVALPWLWARMQPVVRVVAVAALGFPFVYLTTLSWLSDWKLWDWYFYSFRPALCVAFIVLIYSRRGRAIAENGLVLAAGAVFMLAFVVKTNWPERSSDIIDAGFEIQQFAATHPGVYAMGDRSGVVGYLMDEPLVQTEGLVMDKAFLEAIAKQTPLRDVLAQYGVRYYIGNAVGPFTGCFEAVEPFQAGAHSPHMRGEFCETPVAQWENAGVKTMVFDLKPGR